MVEVDAEKEQRTGEAGDARREKRAERKEKVRRTKSEGRMTNEGAATKGRDDSTWDFAGESCVSGATLAYGRQLNPFAVLRAQSRIQLFVPPVSVGRGNAVKYGSSYASCKEI